MAADLAQAYSLCEAQLRAEDHDTWLAALFAPAAARPHLHAIGAFALEVGHVRKRVRQPIAGEIRLQWWQDVVDGQRGSEATANPVAAALVDTIARAALSPATIAEMLDAQRMALYDEPPVDMAAADRSFVALRGTPVRLAARVLGRGDRDMSSAADDAGVALGIADLLGDLSGASSPSRVLLPADLMARRGARQAEVDARRATPQLRLVLADLRAAARSRLAALRGRRGSLGDAGPAFLPTALVEPKLKTSERGTDPFRQERDLPQWRRQWLLWRAARRGGVP